MGQQMNKIWLLKFSEAWIYDCKVVSHFPICSLNINAGYKSVRLKVRGLCLQCALPGVLLLMNSVIYPCWGLRTFGKLVYCELTGMTPGEECLDFLLAGSFGRSVRWLASFQLYRVFLGCSPVGLEKAWRWIWGANPGIWSSDCRSSGWSLYFLFSWMHWVIIRSGRLSIRSGPFHSSWMESASYSWKWLLWLDSSYLRFWARSWKVVASC